ncbi:hypothetical protein SDC9_153035 [bioreactor metagenome]|uniref:Uncharacterized protein n=1 Tax=bioreactor metagenome TaxID=1076179 RepID=A0A645EX25_9ZZZZ
MAEPDAGAQAQQRPQQMRLTAGTGAAEAGLVGVALAPGQKILERLDLGRHGGTDGQTVVHDGSNRDRLEILGLIGQLAVDMRVDGEGRDLGQCNHRAVPHGIAQALQRDAAAGTGLVFHHAHISGVAAATDLFRHASRHRVTGAACGEAVQNAHLLQRSTALCISIAAGDAAECGQRGTSAQAFDEIATILHVCLLYCSIAMCRLEPV